ncbi:MAG: transcriptional regulator, MerR family [Ilumatobacteraceae bacterium]|nr:transcriptional regulator, MerR family [Ilumatobacteraceae bacterium]
MPIALPTDELTIGALSERTGVASSALRFYEAEGLIVSTRTDGGQRRYHRETLRRVSFVKIAQMVGLSLEEIRAALASLPDGRTPTEQDWAELSASWRPRLDEHIAMMTRMRDRLTACIGCGCLSLRVCAMFNPDDVAGGRGPGAQYITGDPVSRPRPARKR